MHLSLRPYAHVRRLFVGHYTDWTAILSLSLVALRSSIRAPRAEHWLTELTLTLTLNLQLFGKCLFKLFNSWIYPVVDKNLVQNIMLTCIHGLRTLLIKWSGFNTWTIMQVGVPACLGIWRNYNYWNKMLKLSLFLCGMLLFLYDLRVDNAWSKLYLLPPPYRFSICYSSYLMWLKSDKPLILRVTCCKKDA